MIGIDRLGKEIERAFFHRRHRILDAAVGSHDDHGHVGVDLLRCAKHAEAIALRQTQIGKDERRLRLLERLHRFRLVARFDDRMPLTLEGVPEHGAKGIFVFDDENLGGSGHARFSLHQFERLDRR